MLYIDRNKSLYYNLGNIPRDALANILDAPLDR